MLSRDSYCIHPSIISPFPPSILLLLLACILPSLPSPWDLGTGNKKTIIKNNNSYAIPDSGSEKRTSFNVSASGYHKNQRSCTELPNTLQPHSFMP